MTFGRGSSPEVSESGPLRRIIPGFSIGSVSASREMFSLRIFMNLSLDSAVSSRTSVFSSEVFLKIFSSISPSKIPGTPDEVSCGSKTASSSPKYFAAGEGNSSSTVGRFSSGACSVGRKEQNLGFQKKELYICIQFQPFRFFCGLQGPSSGREIFSGFGHGFAGIRRLRESGPQRSPLHRF